MTSKYYIHSVPSTIAGVVAAGGSIALLTRDAMSTGFTMDHALMPVLVGLTVLFGHEAWRAAKEWKLISALAFFTLTAFGTGLITYETMGRRAEVRDAKTATETKGVDQHAKLMADLNTANQLEAEAESWVANECRTGLGPKCRGVSYTRDQRRAHAEKLRAAAEAHQAPAPVDAKASRVAAIFALFGYSVDATKAAVQTFEPFVLPLFLELGSIFLFGFGVRHRSVPSVPSVPTVAEPKSFTVEREFTDQEIEELKRILTGRKTPASNEELAAEMGVSKAEISRRVTKAHNAGIIEKLKAGKYNQISLVA